MIYFKDPRCSQSAIKTYLKCPNLYRAQYVDKSYIPEETEAMLFGKTVDCLVTESQESFDSQFDVIAKGKKRMNGLCFDGKYQLKESDYLKALLFKHKIAAQPVMEIFKDCKPQIELYTDTKKAKLDYFGRTGSTAIIADLKTVADLDKFHLAMYDYGYYLQLQFYKQMVQEVSHGTIKKFKCYIIAIDKTSQMKFAVYEVDQRKMKAEEKTINTVLAAMKTGKRLGKGPCYHCPIGVQCEWSHFTKKDIRKI